MLSGVASPHRLVESVKIAYGFKGVDVDLFIVTRATGLASQVGVPEAYRAALKCGKSLIVLSSIKEVFEYLKFDQAYLVLPGHEDIRRLDDIELNNDRCALVFTGEDHGKSEFPGEALSIPELPSDSPPQATIALALYIVYRKRLKCSSASSRWEV